jgi:hypothetical protein
MDFLVWGINFTVISPLDKNINFIWSSLVHKANAGQERGAEYI